MKFITEEQETVIVFDGKTGEWDFYSCVPAHIQLFMENPLVTTENLKVLTSYEGKPTSIRFRLDKSNVATKNFIRKKRVQSERQRLAIEKAREKRLSNKGK